MQMGYVLSLCVCCNIYILRVSIGSQKNTYYMQCRLDKVLLAVAVDGEGHTLERQFARRIHYNLILMQHMPVRWPLYASERRDPLVIGAAREPGEIPW